MKLNADYVALEHEKRIGVHTVRSDSEAQSFSLWGVFGRVVSG